jgi:CO/xanthine dehydrogenase Mo-binding subunit
VLAIVTADSAGPLTKGDFNTVKLLGGPQIDHYHQAVALVVANTFEPARDAAQKIRIGYVTQGSVTSNRRSVRILWRLASMQQRPRFEFVALAVCAAGRILNPKAARSQVIGAMTMGVGAALMEDLVVDKRWNVH